MLCVLTVEDISVVVDVLMSLISLMSPPPDVLGMRVVRGMRGVGRVWECVYVWLGAAKEERTVSALEDWVWALPILWEQDECWTGIRVWIEVVWVV